MACEALRVISGWSETGKQSRRGLKAVEFMME